MTIIEMPSHEAMSKRAAAIIAGQIAQKPNAVLGLATGSSPIGTYAELIRLNQEKAISFAEITTFNLDEYWLIPEDHPESYHSFMQKNLFSQVDIRQDRVHVPPNFAQDVDLACADYEQGILAAGGIDLQLLGLGANGHIAFNEPADHFSQNTHKTALTPETIAANARFFAKVEDVPKEAITTGIGTIMRARQILLIASGQGKMDALEKALYGPVTPRIPASVLQYHPNVVIVFSKQA